MKAIRDKANDSEKLDRQLAQERNLELVSLHKRNRRKAPTQDGRRLCRYKDGWKIEQMTAGLRSFRRQDERFEYQLHPIHAVAHLTCAVVFVGRAWG